MTLRVDAEGLLLALRNLFENALKYTRERQHAQRFSARRRNDAGVLLSVADNGIGFDMEYHDHIFKIFQRLHRDDQYPGTGIGLALVRKAVERMGGRVWAESKPGEGATFNVELPCESCTPRPARKYSSQATGTGRRKSFHRVWGCHHRHQLGERVTGSKSRPVARSRRRARSQCSQLPASLRHGCALRPCATPGQRARAQACDRATQTTARQPSSARTAPT